MNEEAGVMNEEAGAMDWEGEERGGVEEAEEMEDEKWTGKKTEEKIW